MPAILTTSPLLGPKLVALDLEHAIAAVAVADLDAVRHLPAADRPVVREIQFARILVANHGDLGAEQVLIFLREKPFTRKGRVFGLEHLGVNSNVAVALELQAVHGHGIERLIAGMIKRREPLGAEGEEAVILKE